MTGIILLGILILILIVAIIFIAFSNIWDKSALMLVLAGVTCLLLGAFVYSIDIYRSPHHGRNPTIEDVPTEAHIDTIKTVRNEIESVSYEIVWNDCDL